MKKVAIFGGTGFIGQSLAHHIHHRGYLPIIIARHKPSTPLPFDFVQWDGQSLGPWVDQIASADAIVNLAGKSVDCIKTPDNCDLILRSRVSSTTIIGKALNSLSIKPKVWVQMSTAHIYGDPPHQWCTESSSFGYGLAPFVGKAWEQAYYEALPDGVRDVVLRTSFVIGKNGGALSSLSKIVRLGLGGTVGSGTQGMSWIHEYDMNEIILNAITTPRYKGAYIASSPNPVSNKVFMKTLRKAMGIPIGLPAPALLTRVGARLIFRTDPELALYGRYVHSERLESAGFAFRYPILSDALTDLVN